MAKVKNMIQLDEDAFIKNDTIGYVLYTRKDGKFKGEGSDEEDSPVEEEEDLTPGEKPTPDEKEHLFKKTFHNKVSHAIISYMNRKLIDSPELSDYVGRLEEIEKRIMSVDFSELNGKGGIDGDNG